MLAPRPTPGDYVLQFDGTVAGPGPNERRALPGGQYQVLLDVQAAGRRQAAQVAVTVRDSDTTPPDITEFAVLPDRVHLTALEYERHGASPTNRRCSLR